MGAWQAVWTVDIPGAVGTADAVFYNPVYVDLSGRIWVSVGDASGDTLTWIYDPAAQSWAQAPYPINIFFPRAADLATDGVPRVEYETVHFVTPSTGAEQAATPYFVQQGARWGDWLLMSADEGTPAAFFNLSTGQTGIIQPPGWTITEGSFCCLVGDQLYAAAGDADNDVSIIRMDLPGLSFVDPVEMSIPVSGSLAIEETYGGPPTDGPLAVLAQGILMTDGRMVDPAAMTFLAPIALAGYSPSFSLIAEDLGLGVYIDVDDGTVVAYDPATQGVLSATPTPSPGSFVAMAPFDSHSFAAWWKDDTGDQRLSLFEGVPSQPPHCRLYPREDRYGPSPRMYPLPASRQTPGRLTGYL